MEPQTQQTQQNEDHSNNNNNNKGSSSSNFVCRQSSTRWTPTTDQIRILKELYYNNGVRSPSAEQIQRISARLRQYGKIEGKNVFYWFQNHKARERQKKRFTNSDPPPLPTPVIQRSSNASASAYEPFNKSNYHNISTSSAGVSSASASCIAVGAQMGNYGYGSMTMEKSFRDCSISSAAGGTSTGNHHGGGSNGHHNFGSWVGVDHHHPYHHLYDKRSSSKPGFDDLDDDQEASPEIETLPLFPMHGEDIQGFGNIKSTADGYYSGWYRPDDGGNGRTSLELSLNSYGHMSPADYFRSY